MYMKVFPHGQGAGEGPTNYLVREDYPGRDAHLPDVLRGDPEVTRSLIDSLDTKWRFTAGALSWHPDDTVTPEQEQRVMDDFEALAFAGLEAGQRNILWVRHVHAGHHELHFVIPRVELASGKAFNPCPPGWQKHFDLFRDLHNHREGWARPDDPARTRMYTPAHADLHRARLLRWGKTPTPDDRATAKEAIHEYVQAKVEQGQASNRAEVFMALQEAGLEINRAGKDYITVKDPDSGEKLRLKGGMYAEHWDFSQFVGRTSEGQGRTGAAGDGEPDPATVQRLERELAAVIAKRAEYNRGRYPRPAWEFGKQHQLPQPDAAPRLWLGMLAEPAPEPEHPDGRGPGGLGLDDTGREAGIEPTDRDSDAQGAERSTGNGECRNLEHFQGAGTPALRGQGLSADPGGLDNHQQRHGGQARRMAHREEIDHDRTGTDAQRIPDADGTASAQQSDRPFPDPATPQRGAGDPQERSPNPASRTSGLDRALDALERCVRELTALVEAVERAVARQVERLRERQRSRGPGMGL
ncbi:relaxase/mobilization nuclease domain-containing protein [Desulfovibrio sp. MES5]|uniref:relaxase/mobilization nuclease domain-containing protein n=1 Tax=Desulfovibrio sp. MES5 TaxID=1899016 RepID=UPI0013E0806E|nr:relaxase/mobilization nuclease domain-containing protein [Desulfovibrio sp. MES5]